MKLHLTAIIIAVGLATICSAAEVGSVVCTQRYQTALKNALTIKKDCDTAAFYDCCQVKSFLSKAETGPYEISATSGDGAFSSSKLYARCDMDTDNGGWIVIQRRIDNGTVNFYRKWNEYERGFGDLDGEFWIGLQNIHYLTTRDEMELRIDLQDEEGKNVTWTYQQFVVDGPTTNYRLRIGQGKGTAGTHDSMAYHNNRPFSTYDDDNDGWRRHNCAQVYRGAWWYNCCFHSNLNGPHNPIKPPPPTRAANRLVWYNNNGRKWIYYPYVEMKIRGKSCPLNCEQ